MSTRVRAIEILRPGPPGEGMDPGQVAEIEAFKTRLDPETDGGDGQYVRITGGQPRFRTPDAVSPLDKGGVGDGTTDDRAAVLEAIDIATTAGKILDLSSRPWRCGSSITLNEAITIRGGSWGVQQGGGTPIGGGLIFPDGSDGLILEGYQYISLEDLFIRTTVTYGSRSTSGTGHGLTVKAYAPRLDRIHVHGFGLDGIHVASHPVASGINANFGKADQVRSSFNGRDGIRFDGNDSNVWVVSGFNGTGNGGYAIYNNGMYENTFIVPHANVNVTGDFYDDAWGSLWLNPYSENLGTFVIGATSQGGVIIMQTQGAPVIDSIATANTRGWFIRQGQKILTDTMHAATGQDWAWKIDNPSSGQLSLYANTTGSRKLTLSASLGIIANDHLSIADGKNIPLGTTTGTKIGTAATQKLGFYNATPVVQPAANPDTSGATLAELETEVNELKALLRSLGLMAT